MVKAENVLYKVGKKTLLHSTCAQFEAGKFHVIMGANGAGKSTFLKTLSGNLPPTGGHVWIEEKRIEQYAHKQLALKRAVLSQQYHLSFPIPVFDVVMMGRYPHYTNTPSHTDKNICHQALDLMQMTSFADRDYTTLSGGEAQKVQMSRVLAQIWNEDKMENKILFLDEPVSSLDVKYQYQLMKIAKDGCQQNTTVIAVLHDINLAIAFADRILFMKEGSLTHDMQNVANISPSLIQEIFGIQSSIVQVPHHDKPIVVF